MAIIKPSKPMVHPSVKLQPPVKIIRPAKKKAK
jgi:hypothetical protein